MFAWDKVGVQNDRCHVEVFGGVYSEFNMN
jgi:hypothetical protein